MDPTNAGKALEWAVIVRKKHTLQGLQNDTSCKECNPQQDASQGVSSCPTELDLTRFQLFYNGELHEQNQKGPNTCLITPVDPPVFV
jgi:hypothetical protein